MSLAEKLGELAPIARSLFRQGLSWRGGLSGADWRRSFKAAPLFTLLDKPDDVEGLLRYQVAKLGESSPPCILMQPGKGAEAMLPIIRFRYEKEDAFEKVSFRVGFLQKIDAVRFFGFRYESPERGATHDFYHVQPIRGFSKNDAVQEYSCSWMATRFPTFPVVSKDPFELFVIALYSVQGEAALRSFTTIKDNARAADLIKRIKLA